MKHFTYLVFLISIVSISFAQPYYEEAGWAHHGELTYTAFGWSLGNAGDVNGDGYVDMLITAIDYSNPEETDGEEGKIYIYYGSADGLSDTPGFEYETNNDSIVLGFSSDGGDLNGDGYSDIAVGCIQYMDGEFSEGAVFLWYGSPTGPNPAGPDWMIESNQPVALMGSSVALGGDINSDGYDDLFFSAKEYDSGEESEGKTWLYWGSPDGPVESGWSWEANQAVAISGYPVNYAGDVNADGYDDVIIGANRYDYAAYDDGIAVCFYGSPTGLNTTPDWEASCGQSKGNFGHWADGAGDVNGDGYDDVIVSALTYQSELAQADEGRVYVFLGGPDGLEDTYSWFGDTNQAESNLGYSCAGAGDINNDGYDDIIAGAKYWDNGENDEGRAFVWFGSSEGIEPDYCWMGEGNDEGAYYGEHVAGDADFNNDGYSDFLVGAYRFSDSLEADGKAFVYYGAPREAQFHFLQDTFCIDDENQFPVIDGVAGGSFSSGDAVVNAVTGELNIAASGSGWKTINYTSTGLCPVGSFKVFIDDPSDEAISFDYTETNYCISDVDPSPDIEAGATGYFYSADAIVDPLTGTIDLDATGYGGPFTIYYLHIAMSGCEVISSDIISIDYDALFYYTQDTFCIDLANPAPVIDDITEGSFSSDDCSVNAITGKINLIASGTGGPYTIYYNSGNSCGIDSFMVWISDPDLSAADFNYDASIYCTGGINPVPAITGETGGTFSSDAEIDATTGEIDLAATGAGTFTITYTVLDAGGCEIENAVDIEIHELDASFNYDNTYYYQDETDPSPDVVVAGGGFYAVPSGVVFSDANGTVDLEASTTGSYMIYYTVEDGSCTSIDSFALEILAPCLAPIEIFIETLTTTTAEISWNANDYYTNFNVYLVNDIDSVLYNVVDDTSILFTGLTPGGEYRVYVFTDCIHMNSGEYIRTEFSLPSAISNSIIENHITVYPNPANGTFSIELNDLNVNANISLIDAQGNTVFETEFYFSDFQNRTNINVQNFVTGIYILRIAADANLSCIPLIVEH